MKICNICLSKNIKSDRRGIIVCENGHVVELEIEELNEYDGSYGALRKISKAKNLISKNNRNSTIIITEIQNLLYFILNSTIEYYSLQQTILFDTKKIWCIYIQRNWNLVSNLFFLSKTTIKESFSLNILLSLIFIVLRENKVPISDELFFNNLEFLLKNKYDLDSLKKKLPKSLIDSFLYFNFSSFRRKNVSLYMNLLGKKYSNPLIHDVISFWNKFYYDLQPSTLIFLKKQNFKGLFRTMIKSSVINSSTYFWDNPFVTITFSNKKNIIFYQTYCKHFIEPFVLNFLNQTNMTIKDLI